MNEKIKMALASLLNEEVIIASWGFSDLTIKDTVFEFRVSGLIYQGKVTVAVQESEYLICFENGNKFKCTIKNLVLCLDSVIEKTSDYDAQIIKWINSYNSTPFRE